MATQRKTAAERRAEEAAKQAQEAPPAPNPDGIFVEKVVNSDGNIAVNVAPLGNVQITEVQTLLEIGLKTFRDQIGLGSPAGR